MYSYIKLAFYRNLSVLLLAIGTMFSVNLSAALYDSKSGELFLPHLINGSQSLLDVVIKLNPDGTYEIQSGIESALPFVCSSKFTTATLDLIKSAKGKDEVNSILGCHWYNQSKSSYNGAEASLSVSWLDSSCQTLYVGFDSGSGNVSFKSVEQNNAGCNLFSIYLPYNLNKELFYLQFVNVDNEAIASDVYIKFHSENRYDLVSYTLTPIPTRPIGILPTICGLITEADYLAITPAMSPDDVSMLLGCQYATVTLSDSDLNTYSWVDHEFNRINIMSGSTNSVSFEHYRIGKTPN